MSEALAKFVKSRKPPPAEKPAKQSSKPKPDPRSLALIRREAKRWGTTLANGGEGGLPSALVLKVLRRDKYRCACNADHGAHDGHVCGSRENITMHHLGGIARTEELSEAGHENTAENILTICEGCHDALHENARDRGDDSSQVTPEGDVGTRRDHGKPVAHPPS